jgi:hypothetical protein
MYSSTGGTQINYLVIVLLLLSGVLGAVAAASAGGRDTYIEVGGIPKSPKGGEGSSGSELYRRIENSLTGGGGSALGDPVKRLDGSATGRGSSFIPDTSKYRGDSPSGVGGQHTPDSSGLVEKPQIGSGGSTIPLSNYGTFPQDSTTIGQPSNQFCSGADVTIGPDTQSRTHCSNTVGGTVRP